MSIIKVKHQIDVKLTGMMNMLFVWFITINIPEHLFHSATLQLILLFNSSFLHQHPFSCFGRLKKPLNTGSEIKLDRVSERQKWRKFVIWLFPVHWWIGNDGLRLRMFILCSCPPAPGASSINSGCVGLGLSSPVISTLRQSCHRRPRVQRTNKEKQGFTWSRFLFYCPANNQND